jgi:hypothetical protein
MAERTSTERRLVTGIDGMLRSHGLEQRLNLTAARAFSAGAGREMLDYLKSITLHSVLGPHASDAELRHREGMRALVGIIVQRVQLGQKEPKSNVDPQ